MGRLLNLVPAYCNFSPEKSALMFIFSHKAKCKPNSIGIVHSLENAKLNVFYDRNWDSVRTSGMVSPIFPLAKVVAATK